MIEERILKPASGFVWMAIFLVVGIAAVIAFVVQQIALGIVLSVIGFFILLGFFIIEPNESKTIVLFGKYIGSVTIAGFYWINPFTVRKKISLRAMNLNGEKLKVNDQLGNPIEIAAVVVWQVSNTAKAAFEVEDYKNYVLVQSEAAVRHLAGSFPYDNLEHEDAGITLRGGADVVNELLVKELNQRLDRAGILVSDARISHLAYAQEIAGAMLQRQQATAIVAARKQIVEGAVGMVDMALQLLNEKSIVELDTERKAAMVSNLLVVLCSDRAVNPVVNAGTLYH